MPPIGSRPARLAVVLALAPLLAPTGLAVPPPVAADGPPEAPRPPSRPDLTDPVVCLTVRGFRDFVPRDEPSLSRDEKLQIYYEPFNYLIARDAPDGPYRAHLVQDVRVRRAGADRDLNAMAAVIDYKPESDRPPTATYLLTSLSLKELAPGAYEVDLVLRDELAEGRPEAVRTVPFRVVPALDAPPDGR